MATPNLDATYPVAEPNDPLIDVFDPSGTRGKIPASKASGAFQNQYKFATQDETGNWKPEHPVAVSMKDANGNFSQNGWAPLSKAGQGLKDGNLRIGPSFQQKFNNTQGSNIGTTGIDPFVFQAGSKIADAAKSTGKVLKTGGKTMLKIAADPSPTGVAKAFAEEAIDQQADGGIPNSKDVVMSPIRELAGERQPGESATLGFTGHDPAQQPLLTRTATTMSSLLGGDPASAREHFSQAATDSTSGNSSAARVNNQKGTADLLAVPLATAGTARLLGTGALGKVASSTADAASDAARLARLRALPTSALSPDEMLARTLNRGSALSKAQVLRSGAGQELLDLHDATKSALPRIANSANSLGLNISSADDMLSAIRQAKEDLLMEHQNALEPGETLADIGPNQAQALHEDMDALNKVQDRVQKLQEAEGTKTAKAAAKGKIPPTTKLEALNQLASGVGKYTAAKAAGSIVPGGGTATRIALRAAGTSSGFSDAAGALPVLFGRNPAVGSPLDAALTKVFSHPDLAQLFERPEGATGAAAPATSDIPKVFQPFTGDKSVTHGTNITPPETPHGFAHISPDESTLYPASDTQDIYARIAAENLAREANQIPEPIARATAPQEPVHDAVDARAAQTMSDDYLGRHGSALDQARAEWEAQNPGQPAPAWNSDIMRRAGEIDAEMRKPASAPSENDIPDILARAIGLSKTEDLGGMGSIETGANPSTPTRSRPVTRNVNRPPQPPFDATNLAPDNAFKFSRSAAQSGDAAATEWLTSQNLGRLKSMASGRGIPFDGSTDPANLRNHLIDAIAGDLSDKELQNFQDQAIERSRFSAREGRKGKAPQKPMTGEDLISGLQSMVEKKNAVPEPLAKAAAAGAGNSVIPDFIRKAAGIPDEAAAETAGTAHGAGGASVEELSRGEKFWKVNRNGSLTYQGVSPDSNLQPGEALVALGKDGKMRVQGSANGLSDADTLRKFGDRIKKAADPRNTSELEPMPGQDGPTMASLAPVLVIHPDGTKGTVPRKNLERALDQGYTLAQPLDSIAA